MEILNFKELYKNKLNIFKNAEVFDIEYDPSELILRQEAQEISAKIISFMKSRISQHLFVFGGHGSGKTASAKYITKQVSDIILEENLNFGINYINCRFKKFFWYIPRILFNKRKHDSPTRLLENELKKDLILILDEVDESVNYQDFLYIVSRFHEIQNSNKNKIMLILISNKKEWEKTLDSATRSSLSLIRIEFKKYSLEQIEDILKQRINEGLENPETISDKTIKTIANKTLENNSDLRIGFRAIKMLISFLEENKKTNPDDSDISLVYERAIYNIQLERVRQLDNLQFMILYAVNNSSLDASRDIYKGYKLWCEKVGINPWGYTRFVHYTNELENQDFLEIAKAKKEGQDNIIVNKLKLKIKKEVIEQEFDDRQLDFAEIRSMNTQIL